MIKIKDESGKKNIKKTNMNKPIKRGKEINKIFILEEGVFDDINIKKKNLPKKPLNKSNVSGGCQQKLN